MHYQVRCKVFRVPPDDFSLVEVWDILQDELSPIAKSTIGILDRGTLSKNKLRKDVAWTACAIQEFQDFAGKKNAFVKVQVEDGECKGSSGWVLAIDVQ